MFVASHLIFLWILRENLLWHPPKSHLMFFLLQLLETEHQKEKKKKALLNEFPNFIQPHWKWDLQVQLKE